jgi:MFS family permease
VKTPWRKLYVLSTAGALSWLGSSLTTFAVILRDKDQVGPVGVSVYFLAFGVPIIFMSPISGLIADKFSSRQVILPALVIMGLSSASLAANFAPWWVPLALFITSMAGALVGPAMQALEVSITAPGDLPRVTGLMQSMASLGTLFAPALGGILVSTTGYFWPFVIDAFSFWLLAAVIYAINLNRPSVQHEAGEKLSAMAGIKFVFGDRLIRALVVLVGVLIVTLGGFTVGEVFLIKDELHADNFIYGIVGALYAAGSIGGSLFTAAIKVPVRFHPLATIVGVSTITLAVMGLSLAPHWWVAMVLAFITGVGSSALNVYAISIIMTRAPADALGRVNAAIGAIITGGSIIGIVISGIAIANFGVRPVLFVGAVLSAIVMVIFAPEVLRAGRAVSEPEALAEAEVES